MERGVVSEEERQALIDQSHADAAQLKLKMDSNKARQMDALKDRMKRRKDERLMALRRKQEAELMEVGFSGPIF